MRMMRSKGHGAKQIPAESVWLLVFHEAYLIRDLPHRNPREAPAATFFWKDYNFEITLLS